MSQCRKFSAGSAVDDRRDVGRIDDDRALADATTAIASVMTVSLHGRSSRRGASGAGACTAS